MKRLLLIIAIFSLAAVCLAQCDFVHISADELHNAALKTDCTLRAWGSNIYGGFVAANISFSYKSLSL
ncbi:MAG TPA: hypothetical protein ENN07_04650 [candidate division Zixibacteria bacterium]|nr:hypothetical protein [candidate division Zixibacteria bacterium]